MSRVRLELGDGDVAFEVERGAGDTLVVRGPDGVERELELADLGGGRAMVAIDGGARSAVWFARDDDVLFVHAFGRALRFEIAQRGDARRKRKRGGGGDLRTPMPGLVTRVLVAVGDVVEANAPLYGLEAMKMESLIKAPARVRVIEVLAEAGQQVDGGVDVVRVEPLPAEEAEEA
ncbi:MAG: hypothetical protein KC503_32425 [Myxococcales bacterium]|nr:hypothetical protein [Myxococcales bacterium]